MTESAERYLIVRLSALGDVIHALPLLAALRRARPGAEIDWLAEPLAAKLLLADHPMISRLHVVPKKEMKANAVRAWKGPMRALTESLHARNYTAAIDVQGLTKSAFWPWRAGVPQRIGFAGRESRELAGMLNTIRFEPETTRLHVVERNLTLLRGLGIEPPAEPEFPVHIPAEAETRAADIAGANPAPLILINPGAGWATKRWGPEKFGVLAGRLAEAFGARVLVSWGPGEEALASEVAALAGHAAVQVMPPSSLLELGAVAKRARLFIGGDTGPTHLAAALGAPTLSMMGPLDARRNGPYGAHCRTIQHAVPRRAPWWANHRKWVDPAVDIQLITVDEVFKACEAML